MSKYQLSSFRKRCLPAGPTSASIMLVGEAPGESEERKGEPFVGSSGQELQRILDDAGISFTECYRTSVFFHRPPQNKIEGFCGKKTDMPKGYSIPPLARGKYVYPEHLANVSPKDLRHLHATVVSETTVLERLREEILAVRPNIIIAFGNTATWALLGATGIGKLRGTINQCALVDFPCKVIPTYHPASVLRNWHQRVEVLADCSKARRNADSPEFHRIARQIHTEPTRADLDLWLANLRCASHLAVDIETAQGLITMIGFAPSPHQAFVFPLLDTAKPDNAYWQREEDEIQCWRVVRELLEDPKLEKIFQNGLYDIQWLRTYGISPQTCRHDTMLAQHSMAPELPKALGWLASVYTDEIAWKTLRNKDSGKREE